MSVARDHLRLGPSLGSGPYGITAGPDGHVWFVEDSSNKIGTVTIGGSFAEYPIPTAQSLAHGITSGPGGLWFTEVYAYHIDWDAPITGPQRPVVPVAA